MLAGKSRTIYAENASGLLKQFSEGPSDCSRAVLRIPVSLSLLSFAGESRHPQIIANLTQRVPATRAVAALSKGELGEILTHRRGQISPSSRGKVTRLVCRLPGSRSPDVRSDTALGGPQQRRKQSRQIHPIAFLSMGRARSLAIGRPLVSKHEPARQQRTGHARS